MKIITLKLLAKGIIFGINSLPIGFFAENSGISFFSVCFDFK